MLVELSSVELCAGRHLEADCRMKSVFRVGCRGCDVIGNGGMRLARITKSGIGEKGPLLGEK